MPTMKAMQVQSPGADFELIQREIPEPKEHEVLIKVEACGICHGDALAKEGGFPGLSYPRIPGHEVVGTIEKTGSSVTTWKVGQRVGVGWHGGHCSYCRACRNGEFGACANSLTTGLSMDGGYAEYMIGRAEAMVSIPDELIPVEAAPLLCAGATTWGALRHSGARGGDLVAIQGLGGLGHLAVQFAIKLGCKVVVLSRGKEKEALAYKLGAHVYIDTNAGDAAKQLQAMGGARVILCTAPNGKAMGELVGGLTPTGQMVVVAFSRDPMVIPPHLLMAARSISGWVGGNLEETMRFSIHAGVLPIIETFPLEQAAAAYESMMTAKVHFRAVLKMTA
jgi:D-arabinose 1-dehydrogenase-like Zn-dependent alcohol dehydrogenase